MLTGYRDGMPHSWLHTRSKRKLTSKREVLKHVKGIFIHQQLVVLGMCARAALYVLACLLPWSSTTIHSRQIAETYLDSEVSRQS